MASSAWAWLGFFWAPSGLLLLGFFFLWCSSSGDCPSTPFLHFLWGEGASSSRPRGHPSDDQVNIKFHQKNKKTGRSTRSRA
jgi:hypothetical protein